MITLIYLPGTDDAPNYMEFANLERLEQWVKIQNLAAWDYMIVEGRVIKSFDQTTYRR